jgi:hypothetical protein
MDWTYYLRVAVQVHILQRLLLSVSLAALYRIRIIVDAFHSPLSRKQIQSFLCDRPLVS